MERANTLNLTRIPEGCHYDEILQRTFTYDDEISPRLKVKHKYFQQRRIAEDIFEERSLTSNSLIVDVVKSFVSRSLNLDDSRYFSCSDKIYGATLVLDMQISDHEPIFCLIEKQLKKLKVNLCVLRLRSNMMRKKSIVELLEPVKQAKRVFVIIEQAEILNRVLTEAIVGQLKNRLSDETSPTDVIMILFCLSVRVQSLPFDQMNCFGRMDDIVRDQGTLKASVLNDLIRSRGLEFKLGPKALDFIYEFHVNVDASITSVVYLFTYALFEHYHRIEKKLGLLEHDFESLEAKHQFLCDQLDCYVELLRDYQMWPDDISSIYNLLAEYNDLAESVDFANAITNLRTLSQDYLLRKIRRALDKSPVGSSITSKKTDVIHILYFYRDKLLNNQDCKTIVSQFIKDLLRHGQDLENVYKEYESLYFNDIDLLQETNLISMRGSEPTLEYFSDATSYFGILFTRLLQSTGQVFADDLFEDVKEDFLKLIQNEKTATDLPKPIKPAAKRIRKQSTVSKKQDKENQKLTRQDEEGLARAIFVDMIDCLEHQSIIKLDSRSQSTMIKRLAWPTMG